MLCESNFLLLFITCSSKFDCFDTNWMYFGTGLGAWHSRTPDSTLWVTQMQSEWENTCTFKLVNWNTTESWFQKRYRCICWHGLVCFVDCAASSGRFCRGRRSISSSTLFWIKPIFAGNTFKGKWQMLISTKNINFTWISSLCCCMCFKALFRCWLCHFCLIINLFDQEEQLRSDYVYKQCLKIYWLL